MERIRTGNGILDAALEGGIAPGVTLLVSGEDGAGATEFALAVLRAAKPRHRARFLSALRSPARVGQELQQLFGADLDVEVRAMPSPVLPKMAHDVLEGLGESDVVVVESAMALAPPGDGYTLLPFWQALANQAQAAGIVVLLLHAPGTLPSPVEAALAEGADGVLRFAWHDSGPSKRRTLSISKLRGLAPLLDGETVPVFEVTLHKGTGFDISRGNSVL